MVAVVQARQAGDLTGLRQVSELVEEQSGLRVFWQVCTGLKNCFWQGALTPSLGPGVR